MVAAEPKVTLRAKRKIKLIGAGKLVNRTALQPFASRWRWLIGQSHDFWRAYSLFVARVASFAPDRGIIIINTQGQIIQIYFIRKDC